MAAPRKLLDSVVIDAIRRLEFDPRRLSVFPTMGDVHAVIETVCHVSRWGLQKRIADLLKRNVIRAVDAVVGAFRGLTTRDDVATTARGRVVETIRHLAGSLKLGVRVRAVAEAIGKSVDWVRRRVREAVEAGELRRAGRCGWDVHVVEPEPAGAGEPEPIHPLIPYGSPVGDAAPPRRGTEVPVRHSAVFAP